MDDAEFAALRAALIEAIDAATRANDAATRANDTTRNLQLRYIAEVERRQAVADNVRQLRPRGDDDRS